MTSVEKCSSKVCRHGLGKKAGKKSIDMGLRPGKYISLLSGPHTPVTFLDKNPPPRVKRFVKSYKKVIFEISLYKKSR